MTESDTFWSLRVSFRPVIPELDEAALILSGAADAIIAGDLAMAERLVEKANMPLLCEFAESITGPTNREVHRVRDVPEAPPFLEQRSPERMPTKRAQRKIFARDGWRCRFCGIKVIYADAARSICNAVPNVAKWFGAGAAEKNHCAFRALVVSLDHVLPHSRGGDNSPENLVAACYPCQFGRNYWVLEEVGFTDPRGRAPVIDSWDGLTRLC